MGFYELSAGKESNAPKVEYVRLNRTLLHGRWLLLARCTCALLTILLLAFFIASIPVYFAQLQTVCVQGICAQWQLTTIHVRALQSVGLSVGQYAIFTLMLNLFSSLVWFAAGVFIAWCKSDDWLALLTSLLLVMQGTLMFWGFLSNGTLSNPLAYNSSAWYTLTACLCILDIVLIILVFSLFPNGRFAPGWMHWLIPVEATLMVIFLFLYFYMAPSQSKTGLIPPFMTVLWFLIVASILGGQIYRYRRVSSATERQQTWWIVLGTIEELALGLIYLFPPLFFPSLNTPGSPYFLFVKPLLFLLGLFGPLCFAIAILRYRLWDIDIIINRTLVYGMLTASIVAIYALIVGGLGTLLHLWGNLGLSLLATGLIAVLFQPLRQRLQQAVNRLLYGERDDPYKVISRLGQRLEATLAPEAVLPTIVETVTQALKLPYAAISLEQDGEDVIAASSGRTSDELTHLSLVYQGQKIGELRLAPRAPGESFSPADQTLLDDLARQAGIAVHAVRLTKELQHSRMQLVTAREEERRRLRRDLHDGLGSVLASLNWRAGALRAVLQRDPVAADALVIEQQHTIQAAIGDIRRLVYDLRPPALDELGLIGAMRERAAQQGVLAGRDGVQGLRIDVVAPDHLPQLSAAVEVAAYRIVQEALANVICHAHAHSCRISLSCANDLLHVEVIDDGIGLPERYRAGVGLLSLRERTEELGGTGEVSRLPEGGTRVRACLPLLGQDSEEGEEW